MHCTRQFSSLVPRFCLAAVELANEASSVGNNDVEYNDLTGQGLMNHHGAALISSWLDDSLRKGHTLVTVLFPITGLLGLTIGHCKNFVQYANTSRRAKKI